MTTNGPRRDLPSEATSKARFFVLSANRLIGAVMVMLGIMVLNDFIAWPDFVGYVLVFLGIAEVFIVPQILARQWRTPPE